MKRGNLSISLDEDMLVGPHDLGGPMTTVSLVEGSSDDAMRARISTKAVI